MGDSCLFLKMSLVCFIKVLVGYKYLLSAWRNKLGLIVEE